MVWENAMDLSDRKIIEGSQGQGAEVHDQWLTEIISGRK